MGFAAEWMNEQWAIWENPLGESPPVFRFLQRRFMTSMLLLCSFTRGCYCAGTHIFPFYLLFPGPHSAESEQ